MDSLRAWGMVSEADAQVAEERARVEHARQTGAHAAIADADSDDLAQTAPAGPSPRDLAASVPDATVPSLDDVIGAQARQEALRRDAEPSPAQPSANGELELAWEPASRSGAQQAVSSTPLNSIGARAPSQQASSLARHPHVRPGMVFDEREGANGASEPSSGAPWMRNALPGPGGSTPRGTDSGSPVVVGTALGPGMTMYSGTRATEPGAWSPKELALAAFAIGMTVFNAWLLSALVPMLPRVPIVIAFSIGTLFGTGIFAFIATRFVSAEKRSKQTWLIAYAVTVTLTVLSNI